MDSFPINLIDLGVILVLLISGFFAFVRGFVREVLSVAGWVGAGIIALYLFEPLRPHVHGLIPSPLIADIVTGAGIFIVWREHRLGLDRKKASESSTPQG